MNEYCRIVIIGRPNTGKSTLFNRLIGRKRALVHDFPGVTRDRIEEKTDWWVRGKRFPVLMIDTGGLGGEQFSEEIKRQVHIALEYADVILFLLDSQAGLTPLDEEVLRELKNAGVLKNKPILCVVNKVDVESHEDKAADFYSLGLDPLLTLSAEHGRGIEDLKESVVEVSKMPLKEPPTEPTTEVSPAFLPKVAVVGRPNVGKSTLVNTLTGEERVVTSPIPGTTVDSVDSLVRLGDQACILIDTAGVRRKGKTKQGVEVLSVVQTKKALERADVALLVLDGETGISDQDEKIAGMIEEEGCSIILAINKWDTQSNNKKFTQKMAAERIRAKMSFLKYAPILFISGLKDQGLENLGDLIQEILHQKELRIPTHEFTEWLRKEATVHNPQNAKFFLCHQTSRRPPTFVCHVNDPEKIHFSLKRHLINSLRERWGYMGSPVRLNFVERGKGK